MVQPYVKSGEKMTASGRWRCAETGVEATKENSTDLRHNVSFRRQTDRPERGDNATIGSVEGLGMSAASKSK